MRLWTFGFAIAVGMVGCVGGPGEPFSSSGGGSNTSSSGFGSSGDTTSSSSGQTTPPSSSGTSGGGGTSTIVKATDFSQSCTVASDCTAVYSGDVCTPCPCPNAAIASSDQSAYNAKATQARASCGPIPAIACTACPNAQPLCAGGKCSVAIGITIDAGG